MPVDCTLQYFLVGSICNKAQPFTTYNSSSHFLFLNILIACFIFSSPQHAGQVPLSNPLLISLST